MTSETRVVSRRCPGAQRWPKRATSAASEDKKQYELLTTLHSYGRASHGTGGAQHSLPIMRIIHPHTARTPRILVCCRRFHMALPNTDIACGHLLRQRLFRQSTSAKIASERSSRRNGRPGQHTNNFEGATVSECFGHMETPISGKNPEHTSYQ